MKRSLVTAAVLSALFVSAGAFAAEFDSGELIITGKVAGTSCKFLDTQSATIDMNPVGLDVLQNVESGASYNNYQNRTTMPLKIKCSEGTAPRLTFSDSQFDGTDKSITLNKGTAPGVGFKVYLDNTEIKGNTDIPLTASKDGIYTLNFVAKYAVINKQILNTGTVESALTLTVVSD